MVYKIPLNLKITLQSYFVIGAILGSCEIERIIMGYIQEKW